MTYSSDKQIINLKLKEQKGTKMAEESPEFSKHVDDSTHPAGNKELAEEMAYAGYGSRSDAAGE